MIASFVMNRVRSNFPPFLALVLLICLGQSSLAADEAFVWSVQKLNESKPWDRFIGSPKPIRVEGRMFASSGSQFRLLKCEAVFTIEKQKLQSVTAKSYVEVKGQFKKDGAKVVFAVDELRNIPSFADQFDLKASRLQRPKPEDWVELGDWIAERAQFYDDAELSKKANDAYSKSIEAEYQLLKRNDVILKRINAEGRFDLAKKMEAYKLPDHRRMEFVHEGYRIQWRALQKSTPPDPSAWRQFAETLSEQLPGAKEPIKTLAAEVKDAYNQDPDSAYQKANDDVRPLLHRLFFVAVMKKVLLFDESSDGRDGDAIADEMDKAIPEEHALAETYRLKRLEFSLKNIATATRSEAEGLAGAFQSRQLNDSARQALIQWIKAHESRLKGDGVVGLMQLADEYLTLLNDQSAAFECLSEASRIDPTYEGVKTKLAALGYQWQGGRWVKSHTAKRDVVDPQSPAGISIGMSASSLRSLLGQPRSLARAFTSQRITEVWSFGPAGSTPLVVRLEQNVSDKDLRVTALSGE